jgi:hypothetical protein
VPPLLKMPATVVIILTAAQGWKYDGRNSDPKEGPFSGPALDCAKDIEVGGLGIGQLHRLDFPSSGFLRLL